MNSCLYECTIMHNRIKPKSHKLIHKIFMFYLDLDELDFLAQKLPLFSRNRRNLYSFYDSDHIVFNGANTKENVLEYLQSNGVDLSGGRIMLLTNLRTLGYVFNPVSFYFCFDKNSDPVCVVPEIGNTFKEIKPYFIGPESLRGEGFRSQQSKFFYISPFVDLDVVMDFQIRIPGEQLNICIDDMKNGEKFLFTSMQGPRKELSTKNLLRYSLQVPFVTLKVILLIHLHAGILHFLKRVPHHPKEKNPHLQKEVLRAWRQD